LQAQEFDFITRNGVVKQMYKYDSAAIADILFSKVNKADSATAYITPKRLSDSSVVWRALIDAGGGASTTTTDNLFTISSNVLTAKKAVQALSDGATITWNAANGYNARVTLGGNRTLAITNPQEGDYYTITVVQDGTGSRTLTLPGGSEAFLNMNASDSTTLSTYYRNSAYEWKSSVSNILWCGLTSTYTLTSTTAIQKLFNATTNGALTVNGSTTYFFECQFLLTSMSATSGNAKFDILGAGTATLNSSSFAAVGLDNTTTSTAAAAGASFTTTNVSTGNTTAAGTGTGMFVRVTGIMRVNVGGTIIPSVGLTTAAAAVVGVNSFIRLTPVGSNTATSGGSWN